MTRAVFTGMPRRLEKDLICSMGLPHTIPQRWGYRSHFSTLLIFRQAHFDNLLPRGDLGRLGRYSLIFARMSISLVGYSDDSSSSSEDSEEEVEKETTPQESTNPKVLTRVNPHFRPRLQPKQDPSALRRKLCIQFFFR